MAHARGALSRGLVGLGVLLLGIAFSTGAQATAISVELPDLTGALPYQTEVRVLIPVPLPGARGPTDPGYDPLSLYLISSTRTASFDLETGFASISQVSLHLVGHTECPEGGCSPAPGLGVTLSGLDVPGTLPGYDPTTEPIPPAAVTLSGPLDREFELSLSLPAVQGLEDGSGMLQLWLVPGSVSGGRFRGPSPWGEIPPSGDSPPPELVITSARLNLIGDALGDGSLPPAVLPEPSELALAGVALGAFGVRRRRSGKPKAS